MAETAGSPEGLMKSLQSHPHYSKILGNWIPFYSSQSAQKAEVDEKNVRIVLFLDDVAIALTTNESGALYGEVEVMDLSMTSGPSIHPRLIDYRKKSGSPVDENPTSCARCHGSDFRQNWDPYDLWPGIPGGDSGAFHGKKERAVYTEILDRHDKKKGIFQYLEMPVRAEGETDDSFDVQLGNKIEELDSFMNGHTHRRIIGRMATHRDFKKYQYAILAALVCKDPVDGFFPVEKSVRSGHEIQLRKALNRYYGQSERKSVYNWLETQTLDVNRKNLDYRGKRYVDLNGGKAEDYHFRRLDETDANIRNVARLRYVVEGMGIDMRYWSTSYRPVKGGFSFVLPFNDEQLDYYFSSHFMNEVFKNDSALKDFSVKHGLVYPWKTREPDLLVTGGEGQSRFCELLRRRSFRANGVEPPPEPKNGPPPEPPHNSQ